MTARADEKLGLDGKVKKEIQYLSAIEEDQFKIAQANAPLTADNKFQNELVSSRHKGEFEMIGLELILPLWPHLPHRDSGGAEHRADRFPRDFRGDQRLRIHRDPLPPGAGR